MPYDSSLTSYAKQNRKESQMTKAEALVRHSILKGKKMLGYKFTRQKPIDYFILDFYCAELLLGIEIDGEYHNEEQQAENGQARTQKLNEYGITILRFTNDEVLQHLEEVKQYIKEYIIGLQV
ncbi:MAG: endonuclease domain-containing protein [Candidatus Peribacteria bacterium]|jgi:very-short-patch-repair endonuclease|nr:endonuclease domain-containing protein [Candidatus Peribacteria bacterium]